MPYRPASRIAVIAVIGAIALVAALGGAQALPPLDVLIQNGRLMDGAGNPWIRADIGIQGGRIVRLGSLRGATAAHVIDAQDRVVAPGFIDVHSHAAEGLVRAEVRQGQPILAQGITTIVGNPDGGGPVDLAAQAAALETEGIGVNVALLIGHGSVRRAVLGAANRAPTAEELDRMRGLVRQGMEQGAWGLSSGLFYTPGSYAKTEEVIELAKVAAERGGVYTSHVRDEGNYNVGVVASVEDVIRIAETAKLTGIFSHAKALGRDSWGLSKTITSRIDEARRRGVPVFIDQYPYEASSTSLRAALLPDGVALPTVEQLEKALANPDDLPVVRDAEKIATENLRRRGGADSILIAHYRPDRSLEGKTLAQIAEARKQPPVRVALELIARQSPSIVSFNMSEDDIAHFMRQPYAMTSTDGGLVAMGEGKPHPRNYGAFPRKLARYVRERGVVTLEQAIRSMTSLPAAVFGFTDRGMLREGAAADIVIFDPAKVEERSSYTDPHQVAAGMDYVLVNGVVVKDGTRFTNALPGRILRKR